MTALGVDLQSVAFNDTEKLAAALADPIRFFVEHECLRFGPQK